ncbi:MAG: diiron oxygenase [Pseudomonadota bacterium]|nr:diiron oxygenase [Pseudomonadota bacterium]
MNDFSVSAMTTTLERLAGTWQRRASVKGPDVFDEALLDDALPDYPSLLVPFWDHPDFQSSDEPLKQRLLSQAWINYNTGTITAEERIANPAFQLMLSDRFPGTDHESMKKNMIQSLVDEHYHTYMHLSANHATVRRRGLARLDLPHSISYRHYLAASERMTEQWQRDLLTVVWAIVSEISINAYLTLLEEADDIQPLHNLIAKAHNRDEYAHAKVCVEAAKSIYVHMNAHQRQLFCSYLPIALEAFVANDYSVWRGTLEQLGFAKVDAIIGDCESTTSKKNLVRDYSGLKKIVTELGLERDVDFDFGAYE